MPKPLPTLDLDALDVAKPCPASWDAMEGDDRVRFCGQCHLNVYNLAGMTHDDAMALVQANTATGICIRLLRRQDGTVLTEACPVGLESARRRVRRVVTAATALLAAVGSWFGYSAAQAKDLPTILGGSSVTPPPQMVMGRMVTIPPPNAPQTQALGPVGVANDQDVDACETAPGDSDSRGS